jgi:hypothetical protein
MTTRLSLWRVKVNLEVTLYEGRYLTDLEWRHLR